MVKATREACPLPSIPIDDKSSDVAPGIYWPANILPKGVDRILHWNDARKRPSTPGLPKETSAVMFAGRRREKLKSRGRFHKTSRPAGLQPIDRCSGPAGASDPYHADTLGI
ncbi:MAG: hypothetical protein CMJ45_02890 [Planctomyces sp.]|nr:hypothetical protein [Planctomycetaceae bacterium]MBQ10477.1 hypothetical protein [Planctomyces sp.]